MDPIENPADSLEVQPSEDNGNVPVDAPKVETPAEPAAPTEPAKPAAAPELYELPDGRKVDGATLAKEFKENFLPEFTRKSQALAEIEKGKSGTLQNQKPIAPEADQNWVPQSYEEIVKVAEERVFKSFEAREQARVEQQRALENAVIEQLTEVKKLDPNVNENQLFLHANKYGFRDLKAAYSNMKDMSEMAKKVQQTTTANIAKRNDPVSASPGATGAKLNPSNFASAVDYLRALKGTSQGQ